MMISIYIEGKKYIVEDRKNILEVCLSLGFDIPYFCWHPALGSIGACRQCAVKQYCNNNTTSGGIAGNLVMSCMTPALDGMSIVIFDNEILEFRKTILELLMINHPHDCPICEEGGNCHLQDMTVMVGQTYRNYRFTKHTHKNQYLGPFIAHEMNRCITCYRCIRYYNDYADGNDLGVFGIHDNIYFGRVKEGMLQSEFSGNLIEICPTGVFTDKTQSQNYTRKWDMIFAPSICQQCSVGCNIILGERYGKLCRVENRYNGNINSYFLCDRGRFGCGYINLDNRLKNPLRKQSDRWVFIDKKTAIQEAASVLKHDCNKIIGIGSPRASIESNFALRNLVGSDNFYTGISDREQERLLLILEILCNSGIYVPSLREIESYDTILILGEDLTQTGARVALSVRQAAKGKAREESKIKGVFDWQSAAIINNSQGARNPILITSIDKTKLDDIAVFTYYDSVQNQARFSFAVAHALDNTAPKVKDFDDKLCDKLNIVVQKLMEARKPLIISGSNAGSKELIAAAANIAYALKNRGSEVGITFIVSDVNSMGLVMLSQKSLNTALSDICNSGGSSAISVGVIVLENDLYRHARSIDIDMALNKVHYLIVLDHQYNFIQDKANLILSVSSFAESDGTVINYEGRAQRFFCLYKLQNYEKSAVVLESWKWLYLIRDAYLNYFRKKPVCIDQVIDAVVNCFPKLIGIKQASPDSSFRVYGQKLARSSHRYSGRTAIYANIDVHEPYVSQDDNTMFTFSMEGSHNIQSVHRQVAFAWAPGWNSPQAWNKFQDKVGGHLRYGDPGVRLWSIANKSKLKWFNIIPEPFKVMKDIDKWLIAPYWHLFGSDETSQRSKCIQDCMPKPYVMLNMLDALQLQVKENMLLKFICADQILCLPIKLSSRLSSGHIGLPLGFPNIPVFLSGMYAHNVQGVLL